MKSREPIMQSIEPTAENDTAPRMPIRVRVGYPWTSPGDGQPYIARSDPRWQAIRSIVNSTFQWIETSTSKRKQPPFTLKLELRRLRGMHGQPLFDNLRERISEADVLIMDIGTTNGSDYNANVLLETGMALALHMEKKRGLFILKPRERCTPSDLNGFLITEYQQAADRGSIEICDRHGFDAALRGTIFAIARERQMIGENRFPSLDTVDDDDESEKNTNAEAK